MLSLSTHGPLTLGISIGPMKPISTSTRDSIRALLAQGLSVRAISKQLVIGKSIVGRVRKQHVPSTPGPKAGRPAKLSPTDKHRCVHAITVGRAGTATAVAKSLVADFNIVASPNTVRRALREAGLGAAEKEDKPALSVKNIKKRYEFAKRHQDWTIADWNRVIWSDESKINRFCSDGRSWYWKRDGESLQPRHVKGTIKHGGGSVMVWGCMTAKGTGFLCKIDNIMDSELYKAILDGELKQSIEWYNIDTKTAIFQQDNDPKHTSKLVKEYLEQQEYGLLQWPPQSPDMNPIEHLWALVKRRLNDFDSPPSGLLELWDRVQDTWNRITPAECQTLINSMPDRIQALLKAKGRWTDY